MAQYDNTNSGVLFKNDRRVTEKQPDYTGSLNVEGKEFFISAWIREGKKGKFMSLAVNEKDAARYQPKPEAAREPVMTDLDDDDVPF